WPDAGFALFAGGGLRVGQVVGETDSRAERPKNRAVGAQNVLGTLYHTLGIDPRQTLPDFSGRPMRLLDDGEAIAELVWRGAGWTMLVGVCGESVARAPRPTYRGARTTSTAEPVIDVAILGEVLDASSGLCL